MTDLDKTFDRSLDETLDRDLDRALDAVLAHPHPLGQYQRWLATTRAPQDYLFAEQVVRFEPRRDDAVAVMRGLKPVKIKDRVRLVSEAGLDLELHGVTVEQARALLDATDGIRCLLEIRWAAKVEPAVMAAWLRSTFGKVVFAPTAVAALESRLPSSQIVRFVGPPYTVERPYWENMIDARVRYLRAAPGSVDDLVRLLRELHVLTLMGADLDRFYRPASPIADRIVAPGAFYTEPVRVLERPAGPIYLDGPRVRVPFQSRERYYQALAQSLGDADFLAPWRRYAEGGLEWGQVITARSESDDLPVAMFLPPRPIRRDHFAVLWESLSRARKTGDLAALAQFHRAWVRLHPFHCANQSLAMNIVNAVLSEQGGGGIPHLILDLLALRLSEPAYAEVFRRAVAAFGTPIADPAARFAALHDRQQRSQRVIHALAAGQSYAAVAESDPDALRWALLTG
ncbi:MAG: hypothetical protein KC731_31210 [Myxococcales bacterium]|nr:hypothetical protein [Myxococcales bacterium]